MTLRDRLGAGADITAGSRLLPAERNATVLSWTRGYARQRYVRHRAVGNRTLCGIELGGQVADPPDFDAAAAESCQRCSSASQRAGLRTGEIAHPAGGVSAARAVPAGPPRGEIPR